MFSLRPAKAQIALEFIIVYSLVLVVFLVIFGLVVSQRASSISQQEYGSLELIAQNVAGYIDQAVAAGNGYYASIRLPPSSQVLQYNISLSTTGVVMADVAIGHQIINAYAYSTGRNLNINGTLNSSMSGSGISVYSLPTASGFVSLYNSKGAIFIDELPVSTLNLSSYMSTGSLADLGAASFNGQNSYGYAPNSLNLKQASTIGMWVFPSKSQSGNFRDLIGKGMGQPYIDLIGSNSIVAGIVGSAYTPEAALKTGVWSYITASYSTSGNTITLYIDGNSVSTSTNSLSVSSDTNPLTLGSTNATGISGGVGGAWFNGSIANVQLYNSTLSAGDVSSLYSSGVGALPLNTNTLVAWWPLNANMQDYSGHGNHMAPFNVNFTNLIQVPVAIAAENGLNSGGDLVGFVASNGIASIQSSQSRSFSGFTNASGRVNGFIEGNFVGTGNITVDAYDYNLSVVGNLIGWWPMDAGYGNTIYDLSGQYKDAVFPSASWAPIAANATAFEPALFNGKSSAISGTLSRMDSQNITISAWINSTGTGTYSQNIAEVSGQSSSNAAIAVNAITGNAIFAVNGKNLSGGVLSANTIYLVTGVWNGNNDTMALYLNGSLVSTGIDTGISSISTNAFNIGGAYGPFNAFNGIVSNVQLYSGALTSQQISGMYKSGMAEVPLPNEGLFGWWPLDNATADYGPASALSSTANGISFRQFRYVNGQGSSMRYLPAFDGLGTANTLSGYPASNALSMGLWFYPENSTNSYEFPLYSNTPAIWGIGFNSANQVYVYPGNGQGVAIQSKVSMNSWNQVTVTAKDSGSNTAYIVYLNGVDMGNGTLSGNIKSVSNLVFGANTFTGQIADVLVYNTTLSRAAAQQLYLQGLPLFAKINVSSG